MLISVALPLGLFRTFTYAVEDADAARAMPGMRAVVPFRARKHIGMIVGPADPDARIKPKRVLELPDQEPVMDAELLALCRWLADYYVTPLGIAIRTALPAALGSIERARPAQKSRRVASITRELPSLMERDRLFARSPQGRAVYELLESLGGRAAVDHLVEHLGCTPSVVARLAEKGFVEIASETVARDPFANRPKLPPTPHEPSAAQRAAIAAAVSAPPGQVLLLHGVTGSGKTLVYIELLRRLVSDSGRGGIVLVPEIALTPQTVDRFRAAFGDTIAVLHSALSDGERYDEWLAVKRGEKRIVVGARSAIFAPVHDLGAIIVDEEHESSYKQGENPRYHAREVAIVRARAAGAVVVLGSATPSLESWVNAQTGKYTLLSLPDRAGAGKLPRIQVVDRRAPDGQSAAAALAAASADPLRLVVSEPLELALSDRLRKREQAILLLNRRGYSAFVQCGECGDVAACPNCSISLTLHRAPERLVCHYCQHAEPPRVHCVRCGGTMLRHRGLGTQQVERLLCDRFPAARVARMDVDTTSGKWAHAEILDRVASGEVDILLGTQMIAKGLDFPNVTLVGVIDADIGINMPDFRASERCFQLLSQVAGRAGRGSKGGEVFIQTRVPGHHAVTCAVAHDYSRFVREELQGRESPRYPPTIRLANIVFSGLTEEATQALATDAATWMQGLLNRRPLPGITLVGPAPCPIERIKNRWRWHLLVKSEQQGALTRLGQYFMERFDVPNSAELRVSFDRDPVALL